MTMRGHFVWGLAACACVLGLAAGHLDGGAARAATVQGDPIPESLQREIEEKFNDRFVYPDTTEWHFISRYPYPGTYGIVCGILNYQNAMHKLSGARHFYAIMDESSVRSVAIELDEEEDRTGEAAFKMKTFCHLP